MTPIPPNVKGVVTLPCNNTDLRLDDLFHRFAH